MSFYENLNGLNLRNIYAHEIFANIGADEQRKGIENLLSSKPAKQIAILNIDDGFLQMQADYRYLNSSGTFTTGGHIALHDYCKAQDLIAIEKEFNQAYPIVQKQAKAVLSSMGITAKGKTCLDIGFGRKIDGAGSFFLYNSNEYNQPKHNEISYAAELLKEELSVAAVSLASMFDMFRLIIKNEESSVHPIIYSHVKDKIGHSEELIRYFLNKEETTELSQNLSGLKKGDGLLGIKDTIEKGYQIH